MSPTLHTASLSITMLAGLLLAGCQTSTRCTPGCDGNTVVRCDGEAEWFGDHTTRSDCGPGSTCVARGSDVQCVDSDLTPCSGADKPTGCTGDSLLVQICTSVGYNDATVRPCGFGFRCVEANGTAACVDGNMVPCDPDNGLAYSCSDDGQSLITAQCEDVGYAGSGQPTACDPGNVCVEGNGTAVCALTPIQACDPLSWIGPGHCEGDELLAERCSYAGYVVEISVTCELDQICAQKGDMADCSLTPLRPCQGNYESICENNAKMLYICNSIGYAASVQVESCDPGLTCVVDAQGFTACVLPT